jgi:hypothetical protein
VFGVPNVLGNGGFEGVAGFTLRRAEGLTGSSVQAGQHVAFVVPKILKICRLPACWIDVRVCADCSACRTSATCWSFERDRPSGCGVRAERWAAADLRGGFASEIFGTVRRAEHIGLFRA